MKKRKPPLGADIVAICKEYGITQKTMASEIEVEPEYLNLIVNGHKYPSVGLLATIAQKYNKKLVIKFYDKRNKPLTEADTEIHDEVKQDLQPKENPHNHVEDSHTFTF